MSLGDIIGAGSSLLGGILSKKSGAKEAGAIRTGSREAAAKFDPFLGTGSAANTAIAEALGLGGPGGQAEQFQNFLDSTGFQAQLQAGSQAITGSRAARGLLGSGATLKRLTTFGQDLAQQGFSNFLGQLGGVAQRGLGAAGGAAQSLIGGNIPAAAAERRGEEGFQSGLGDLFGGAQRFFGANTPSPVTSPAVVGGVVPFGPGPGF